MKIKTPEVLDNYLIVPSDESLPYLTKGWNEYLATKGEAALTTDVVKDNINDLTRCNSGIGYSIGHWHGVVDGLIAGVCVTVVGSIIGKIIIDSHNEKSQEKEV